MCLSLGVCVGGNRYYDLCSWQMKSLFHFLQSCVCPGDRIVLQKHSKAFSVLHHTILINLSISLHDLDPTLTC